LQLSRLRLAAGDHYAWQLYVIGAISHWVLQ
jgi:hypothetical protein